jgi:hypothetical protein
VAVRLKAGGNEYGLNDHVKEGKAVCPNIMFLLQRGMHGSMLTKNSRTLSQGRVRRCIHTIGR